MPTQPPPPDELNPPLDVPVQAKVLVSVEEINFYQHGELKLGSCDVFRVRRFRKADGSIHSLACFEGCSPDLGCTIVLRGADEMDELNSVKRVPRCRSVHMLLGVQFGYRHTT